jgi:predicted HTH domain antitoxin
MATKIRIPSRVVEVLEEPIEKSVVELIAIGLYRDGKITLRQAADLVSVDAKEMLEVLEKQRENLN